MKARTGPGCEGSLHEALPPCAGEVVEVPRGDNVAAAPVPDKKARMGQGRHARIERGTE